MISDNWFDNKWWSEIDGQKPVVVSDGQNGKGGQVEGGSSGS